MSSNKTVTSEEEPRSEISSAGKDLIKSEQNYNFTQKEKEKRQLAEKIRKENESFMKSMELSKIERLKYLLKQTEIFSHFLVNPKNNSENALNLHSKQGKKAIRKRAKEVEKDNNLLKSLKEIENNDENDFEEQQVTRLYFQPSILTGGKLTDYQMDGINFLINLYETGLNGILADEMGLGKTIQSIAFLSFLKQYKKKQGYFLIVVPKSTMPNWSKELKTWCPSLNVVVLNPVKEQREEIIKNYISKHKFEVVITSYEGVNICISNLKKIKWEVLIIDEAHRIKNEQALLSKNVRLIESKFRLLVTGTPLQNNLHELWSLLNFLLPDLFSSSEDFDEWFGFSSEYNNDSTVTDQEERNFEIIHQLHKILKPFLLRRTKNEVEKTLPPKKEIHIKVGLTETQKSIYKKLLTSSLISDSKTVYKNIIMQLRKVCNHPYLFDGIEDPNLPEVGEHLIINSSKMRILDKLLSKLKLQGSQVLIFSQMTRTLDIIEDYCTYRGYKTVRIDGGTSLEDREIQIQDFTRPNSQVFLFLLSTRAGGLGLNLMTADTVILFDSDWNPQVDLQAMDRVHRIGQTKNVLVYRLICENTIEEKIIERQAMRLKLDSMVIQQGRVLKNNENFTKDQMKEMIQYGADKIFKAGDDFKDEEIDIILERGEKNTNAFFEETEKQAKCKTNLLLNMSFNTTDLYKFENEDYMQKRKLENDVIMKFALVDEFNDERMNRRKNICNYNIDQNFDHLLQNKNPKKKTRAPKIPYYHLYNHRERLYELKSKQISYFLEKNNKLPEKFDEDITISEGLNNDEIQELNSILKTGFIKWDKKEYEVVVSMIDKYGRNCFSNIKNEIDKSLEEIKEYCKAFWERINDLPDGGKILRNIEKREKVEKQKENASKLISKKMSSSENSYENIKLNYPTNYKNTEFSTDEDQFLIYLTHVYGYGNWDDIIKAIRLSEEFMFNYFFKSRDKAEIQKRVDYLIKLLEREYSNSVEVTKNNILQASYNNLNIPDERSKKRRIDEDENNNFSGKVLKLDNV